MLLLLAIKPVWAQQPVMARVTDFQQYAIEQISLKQGLSQGMVFDMVQDEKGYIWAGTKEGLNRYDGTGFKVFRHNPQDSLSISSNAVTTLAFDNKHRLWVGTEDNGINLFDPATESFIRFKHQPGNPNSIPGNKIRAVTKDGNGNLIFEISETGHVVLIEKPGHHQNLNNAFEFKPIQAIYPQLKNMPAERFSEIPRICFSLGGDLWFNVNDTIYGYTAQMLRNGTAALKFYYPVAEDVFVDVCPPFFFDAKQNRTFITSHGNVLKQFDHRSQTFIPVLQLPQGYTFRHSLFIDEENNVWGWLPDKRLIKANLTDGKMTVINLLWQTGGRSATPTSAFAFRGMHGNLWLRSSGYGIFKISSRNNLFKQLSTKAPEQGTLIWNARIEQAGVKAAFNPLQLQKLTQCLNNIQQQEQQMLYRRHYKNVALDKKGLFWIPGYNAQTDNNVIACIDPVTNTYKEYNDTFELGSHYYGVPIILDNNDEVWFSERISKKGVNLYHLNQNTGKVEAFPFPVTPNNDPYHFIADYYQDADGLFWLATRDGLFTFHPQTKKWQHFVNKPSDTSSLSKNQVLSLCPDPAQPRRYLWVGTEGAGLNRFDIDKKSFTCFTTKHGLPNNVIYGIQSDAHNNLWISTNNGICQFNPQTFATRNFTQADGLVSNEFNRYEFSKAPDGTLYFGSPSGTNYFQPEDFYTNAEPSAVVINKLKLLNKEVVYEHNQSAEPTDDFSLPAPIEHCKELVFNYNHRMITLGFAAMDLTIPSQNRFKYMLQGLDNDWIEAGTQNEATYTNLSPGSYTFKVMGCNSSNLWSSTPTTLKIRVLPPWWGTWWFRLLVAIVVVAFLYALYRYRLFKALELERVRNRIAQDLHDEIGSTLSSISLYSAAIQRSSNGLSTQNYNILTKISQSTTKMMEGMNDMVWVIKADNDNFEHMINRMRAFAVSMAEAKDIQLHFNADERTQKLSLNMEQRKNMYLIFKETVNNAAKYSDCKKLDVSIKHHAGKLEMIIEDDGEGFDQEAAMQNTGLMGGNGLKNIKLRAKNINGTLQIDTQKGRGTKIAFTMVLQREAESFL